MQTSKLGNIFGAIGIIGGIFYGMKKKDKIGTTAIYAIALGIAGVFIGNSVTKFYE
jgi:hypothetical protein